MDDRDNNYVNQELSWRDAAAPVLALGLAVLFWAVFAPEHFGAYGPGLGVPVFVGAYFAAVLLMLGREVRWSAGSAVLTAASMTLAVCCALYALPGFLILNCLLILLTAAMATFSLSGQARRSPLDIAVLPETVRLSVLALFTRVGRPFRMVKGLDKKGRGALWRAILAVFAAVPLVCLVVWLLSSADAVFASFFTAIARRLSALGAGAFLRRAVRAVALALFIASGLYFLRDGAAAVKAPAARPEKQVHVLPYLLVTLLLDGVYLLFCAIQIKYLFGGREAAAMAGGWAAYAREGFFQLVAVAAINLGLCLLSAGHDRFSARGGPALRAADGLTLALTAIVLASAFRRMGLYIAAYGLSVLRFMTLWGMLVIAAGLLAMAWKLCRPSFSFFSVFGGFALGTWCLLCLCGPGGMIARYNVDACLDGRLESVDVGYLAELTTDALGPLRRLAEESGDEDTRQQARAAIAALEENAGASRRWTQRKGSFRNAR